jgi:hypothetical protein
VAAAGQRDFNVPFAFLSPDHVTVTVNGGAASILEWVGATTLRLASTSLQAGDLVVLARNTPIDDLVVRFLDGAILTAEDLNTATLQLLYKQQELTDLYNGSIDAARQRIILANGVAVDAADIANQVAAIAAESSLLDDFRARVSDIDANGWTLIAQGQTLDTLSADSIAHANSISTITGQVTDLTNDLTTLQGVVDSLATLQDGTGIATVIDQEQQARIDGDNALAGTIALIGAKSGDNLAFILDLNKVKVSPTESMATRLSALAAADSANAASIVTEQNARIAADSAEVTARTTLAATLRSETAAAIATEQEARADAVSAEAAARTQLAATVGQNTAAITSEASTRASADAVFTGLFTLLGAKNAAGTAFVLDDSKVQLSNGTALGTRLSGIDAAINGNSASITNEITARVNGDNANASAITSLQSTVNGHTASITTLQSTTNGLNAKYGVALDVNGYITGFVQNNNGTSGTFAILADKFAIVTPGQNPTVPFEVSNGTVYVNGQRITPGSIGADRINVTSLSALSATIGLLRTAATGARLELESNQIRVYDTNNVLRVRMGIW